MNEDTRAAPLPVGAVSRARALAARWTPSGRLLSDELWLRRHKALAAVLWLHVPGLLVFALGRGVPVRHSLLDVALVAGWGIAAVVFARTTKRRRLCAATVALGLLTASALVVHLSSGAIEAHFHFFVVIALLFLYEDWLVFLLAVAYVGVHHGILGEFAPASVFNHPDGLARPWQWALIHAAFIAAMSIANIAAWRLNENARTEARIAREEAEHNERLFREAFADAPIGVGIIEPMGRWLRVNAAMCALLGKTEREVLSESFEATTHPDDIAAESAKLQQLVAGEIDSYQIEARLLQPGGDVLWVLVTVSVGVDRAGGRRLIRYAQPITELKSAETSLRQAQHRYRMLVEQLPLAVYIDRLDDRSSNIYTSPQIEEMVGYTADEWMSDPDLFVKALHPDDRERVLAEIADTNDSREEFVSEYRLIAADGREVWVRDRSVVVRDDDGERELAQGYLLDITQEKALEERARQSQKMEAVGQLAGGIAHDFNNLLTAIQGYCSLALEQIELNGRPRDEIEKAAQAAANASSLTEQLLAFSRAQNFQTETLMVDRRVAETEALLRRVIGENIELETELRAPDAAIELDRGALEQVLVNLVVNARDAVAGHGRITIRTDSSTLGEQEARRLGIEAGPALRLRVSDDGCGIDEAMQSRIFEPFFTSKPVGHGTGLGLSTVYAIVKRSKGAISVQSAPGAGTTIEIWLPRHAPVEVPDEVVAAPSSNGCNERVLLVEDERVVRELVAEVLDRRGYEVTTAASPADALALCDTVVPFDVVVTDVVMPGMNGRELVESLRRLTDALRVVYVSGYADDVLPADSLRNGERFLQKPFQLDALITTVREVLEDPLAVV